MLRPIPELSEELLTMRSLRLLLFSGLMAAWMLATSGCAYMADRGGDLLDIVDIGLTFSDHLEPDIGLYIDYFNIIPLGGSRIDGKMLGIGNRRIGWMDYEHNSWGVVLCGTEQKGCGPFEAADPHQARRDQTDATERPRFGAGLPRMIVDDNRPPFPNYIEVDRCLHLGWIGIYATARPLDLIDFIVGFTTLDFMGDDKAEY
jgi:hypothetical protein